MQGLLNDVQKVYLPKQLPWKDGNGGRYYLPYVQAWRFDLELMVDMKRGLYKEGLIGSALVRVTLN